MGEPGIEAGDLIALARWEKARRHFVTWLGHVKIMEPPPGRGVIPFELWPHLREDIEIIGRERLIVRLKSRQIGYSWMLAAYGLWTVAYHRGAYVALISQGEPEAMKLLGKSRFIYGQLPGELQEPLGTDSRTEMSFPRIGSSLQALPSTEKAGRSATATLVVMDEADYHEYLEENYNAVKPTIDDSGGKLIVVSTANPRKGDSLFKRLYREAPGNGFHRAFYGWRVRAGRDDAWYNARKAEYPDKSLFEKEYPETDDQALAPPRTLAAFDHGILDMMQGDIKAPIEIKKGFVHIYQGHYVGKRYVAATDTSHGTGRDYGVTVLLDLTTGYVVADIMSDVLAPEQLAQESMDLLSAYGNPLWGIEDNDWGKVTLTKAQGLRYPRLYYRAEGKVGWHTSERTRYILWGELIEAVVSRQLSIPSKEGLGQFYSVIRNPDKEGRIEAQGGAHDDYPMTVGLAWQLRKHAYGVTYQAGLAGSVERPGRLRQWSVSSRR